MFRTSNNNRIDEQQIKSDPNRSISVSVGDAGMTILILEHSIVIVIVKQMKMSLVHTDWG